MAHSLLFWRLEGGKTTMRELVKFWGVRGSIASPGPHTSTVGGNTSCVEARLGDERIVLDAGTGIRTLGMQLGSRPLKTTVLFSHLHWDHIQGLPFFGPLYHPGSDITLVGPEELETALRDQMSGPTFPVSMEAMGARKKFVPIAPGDSFSIGEVRVTTCALRHPGGAVGYRLCLRGRVVSYVCDNEHPEVGMAPEVLELASRADLLIYDAQYLPEEYPAKAGWGHSTFEKGCELARAAGVHRLVLTHHEPTRSDAEVGEMERRAMRLFGTTWAAREGMEFDLEEQRDGLPLNRALEAYLASALASG